MAGTGYEAPLNPGASPGAASEKAGLFGGAARGKLGAAGGDAAATHLNDREE